MAVDPHVDATVTKLPSDFRGGLDERDLADADLVVLVTDHPEFDVDTIATRARLVLDTRGRVPRDRTATVEWL